MENTPELLLLVVLIKVPDVNVPFTPDSFASGQPSPSESKSNLLRIPSPSRSSHPTFLTPISSIRKSSPVLLFPAVFVCISKITDVAGALRTILYFNQLKFPCKIFPVFTELNMALAAFLTRKVKFEDVPNDVIGFAINAENSYCSPTVKPVIVFVYTILVDVILFPINILPFTSSGVLSSLPANQNPEGCVGTAL